jgi:hypothetical protein
MLLLLLYLRLLLLLLLLLLGEAASQFAWRCGGGVGEEGRRPVDE